GGPDPSGSSQNYHSSGPAGRHDAGGLVREAAGQVREGRARPLVGPEAPAGSAKLNASRASRGVSTGGVSSDLLITDQVSVTSAKETRARTASESVGPR